MKNKLSKTQKKAFDLAIEGHNIFIGGDAGTGKSFLIEYLKNELNAPVLAPTGLAALNVGGSTIHRFFKLPMDLMQGVNPSRAAIEVLKSTKTIIIDEISMVRSDVFATINNIMRTAKSNSKPFGGIQLIVVGDLGQLPPVVPTLVESEYLNEEHNGHYFFQTDAYTSGNFIYVELKSYFRQKDKLFIKILNNIRVGTRLKTALKYLNKQVKDPIEGGVFLCGTNRQADIMNNAELRKIKSDLFTFEAETDGIQERNLPVDSELNLKLKARVMTTINDSSGNFVNGSLGTIIDIDVSTPVPEIKIEFDSGNTCKVEQFTWTSGEYKKVNSKIVFEETGSFTQFPLKLAYGLTIHKAQGSTLDNVNLDIGKAFASGQLYVALSRVRKLSNLSLRNKLTMSHVIIDKDVFEFLKSHKTKITTKGDLEKIVKNKFIVYSGTKEECETKLNSYAVVDVKAMSMSDGLVSLVLYIGE